MLTGIRDYLPRQLALNDVTKTEEFLFEEIEVPSGESEYKEEYTLSKAPIKRIVEVVAVVDGGQKELTQGKDFVLENDSTVIFNNTDNRPDLGTNFEITYTAESILSRYIDSIEEQTEYESDKIGIDAEEGTINGVTASKYISTADSDSLDEIGKLFGDLGRRAGRSTERYREYLQSIARVYTGSGRKSNVAEAAATVVSDESNSVDPDSIGFREWFDDDLLASEIPFDEYEYDIRFNDFEDHRISLIDDVIDIADPSGVRLRTLIYVIDDEDGDYIEGPQPDLSKWDGIDSYDAFDDDFISPFNHESPTRGAYPSNVSVQKEKEILDVDIENEIIKPISFEWATRVEPEDSYKENGNWQEFQWGENSWSGDVDSEPYYTGVDWEQADWNKFPYTDYGVVGDEYLDFSDVPNVTVADRTIESPTVSDPAQVTPNITFPKSETTYSDELPVTSEVDLTVPDLQESNDVESETVQQSGFIWSQANWDDNVWSDLIEIVRATDPTFLEIQQSPFDEFVTVGDSTLASGTQSADSILSNDTKTLDIENIVTEDTIFDEKPVSSDIEQTTTESSAVNDIKLLDIEDTVDEDTILDEGPVVSDIDNSTTESTVSDDLNPITEIEDDSVNEATVSNDIESVQKSGLMWSQGYWNQVEWDPDAEFTTIAGSTFSEIDQAPLTEDTTSSDSPAFDISKFAWANDNNWNTMQWSEA